MHAVCAADGYYWITGRVDDVINVSGHRIGTAEVESALVLNPKCAEAAVVGYEHPIKGQGIYAYVTLMDGVEFTDELRNELRTYAFPTSTTPVPVCPPAIDTGMHGASQAEERYVLMVVCVQGCEEANRCICRA